MATVHCIKVPLFCQTRNIHQTSVLCKVLKKHGWKWRINQGMSRSGTEYGVLTDMPDYSFLDGRPTPLSTNQQKRRQDRIETAKDIMEKLGQVDFAKERFELNEQAEEQQRQSILARKLKPKS